MRSKMIFGHPKKKVAYWSEMARNAIESDIWSFKMATGILCYCIIVLDAGSSLLSVPLHDMVFFFNTNLVSFGKACFSAANSLVGSAA